MSVQEYLLTLGIETKLLIGGLVGTVAGVCPRQNRSKSLFEKYRRIGLVPSEDRK